jgi:hypothetical protein
VLACATASMFLRTMWEDGFVAMSLLFGEPLDAIYMHRRELFDGTKATRARALARELAELVSDINLTRLRATAEFGGSP